MGVNNPQVERMRKQGYTEEEIEDMLKCDRDRRILLEQLVNAIGGSPIHAQCEVTNAEREFLFTYNGIKYKVVLSAPRS